MRVITPFGFGSTPSLVVRECSVVLDVPHLGQKELSLERRSEIFLFSDWAVVRVLNITGRGWFSNIQFHHSAFATQSILGQNTPPDETIFFLNLRTGEVRYNNKLGILAEDTLWMRPWLDRWAREETVLFETQEAGLKMLQEERKTLRGTAGGICSSILLDISKSKILWFLLIAPPTTGVFFEKKFV